MKFRRFPLLVVLFAALVLGVPEGLSVSAAEASPSEAKKAGGERKASKSRRARRARRKRRARKARRARARRRRARRRRRRRFRGHAVDSERLRSQPLPKTPGELEIVAPNLRQRVEVDLYDDSGEFRERALVKLDGIFRCRRTDEVRAVDPRLYRVLSVIYEHFGEKPIHLISGFRFQRNESSRHFHASAMDIRIPGVPVGKLYRFAKSLDRGGMGIGIYPRSGFVHIDFRAPGAPSYRWIDRSGPGGGGRGKRPNKVWRRRRNQPNS